MRNLSIELTALISAKRQQRNSSLAVVTGNETTHWHDLLNGIPDGKFIPLDGFKRPIDPKTGRLRKSGDDWKNHLYTTAELDEFGPCVKAVGILLGPLSGLLVVDLDGPGSDETLRLCTGLALDDLPKTVVNSSGRPGRKKLFFRIKEEDWEGLSYQKFKHPDDPTKGDVEVLWEGRQAVVAGAHPNEEGDGYGHYEFEKACSPAERAIAHAPYELIALCRSKRQKKANRNDGGKGFVKGLQWVEAREAKQDAEKFRNLLENFFVPGEPRWQGYDFWLMVLMIGHEISVRSGDPELLLDVCDKWSSKQPNYKGTHEIEEKWHGFKKSDSDNAVGLGSLVKIAQEELDYELPKRTKQAEAEAGENEEEGKKKKDRPERSPLSRNKSVDYRLNVLQRYLHHYGMQVRNTLRRRVLLRSARKRLGLAQVLKDPELATMVMAAQDKAAGNYYEALNAAQRKEMEIPDIQWVIPELIPANDATLLVGAPKVGKTRLAVVVVKAILEQQGCIGCAAGPGTPEVIFISDDQSPADTAAMFRKAEIMEHERLLWSPTFRMDEEQLDRLLSDIKAHPGAVVVIDSLRSTTTSTGVDENTQEMGTLVYDLKRAAIEAGGTLMLIHHGSKQGGIGQDALSGHNSIGGACNGVIHISYLVDDKGRPQKSSNERRVIREARTGESFDNVVAVQDQGPWTFLGSFESYEAKQEEKDQEAKERTKLKKLNNSQTALLAILCDRFDQKAGPASLLDLMKEANLCKATRQRDSEMTNPERSAQAACRSLLSLLSKLELVVKHSDESGTPGSGRRYLYELNQDGRNNA